MLTMDPQERCCSPGLLLQKQLPSSCCAQLNNPHDNTCQKKQLLLQAAAQIFQPKLLISHTKDPEQTTFLPPKIRLFLWPPHHRHNSHVRQPRMQHRHTPRSCRAVAFPPAELTSPLAAPAEAALLSLPSPQAEPSQPAIPRRQSPAGEGPPPAPRPSRGHAHRHGSRGEGTEEAGAEGPRGPPSPRVSGGTKPHSRSRGPRPALPLRLVPLVDAVLLQALPHLGQVAAGGRAVQLAQVLLPELVGTGGAGQGPAAGRRLLLPLPLPPEPEDPLHPAAGTRARSRLRGAATGGTRRAASGPGQRQRSGAPASAELTAGPRAAERSRNPRSQHLPGTGDARAGAAGRRQEGASPGRGERPGPPPRGLRGGGGR